MLLRSVGRPDGGRRSQGLVSTTSARLRSPADQRSPTSRRYDYVRGRPRRNVPIAVPAGLRQRRGAGTTGDRYVLVHRASRGSRPGQPSPGFARSDPDMRPVRVRACGVMTAGAPGSDRAPARALQSGRDGVSLRRRLALPDSHVPWHLPCALHPLGHPGVRMEPPNGCSLHNRDHEAPHKVRPSGRYVPSMRAGVAGAGRR